MNIDYGCKAPSRDLIEEKLGLAGLAWLSEDGDWIFVGGVTFDFIGPIAKSEATYDDEGGVIAEAVMTSDVHANLRFSGHDAAAHEAKLKSVTRVAYKADSEGAPATEGTVDGFKIYPLDRLSTPLRVWG